MQKTANEVNCVFFLYAGDSKYFSNQDMDGEDLMGWLIPSEKAEEFEYFWLNDNVEEKWDDFFCFAIWKNEKSLTIEFSI